jgi:hypothetical protein
MDPQPNQMADFAKTARDAVSELEEPLKTEAFKIILQQLVNGQPVSNVAGGRTPAPPLGRKAPRKKPAAGKKDKPTNAAPSTLNLGVTELKTLKAFCEGFPLTGTEQVAFLLANFVREHTDLQAVTASDLVYLHRMLISQKVKVIPVNDPGDWARALMWLTAPSRRKEWLKKGDSGYVVSNSGLLRWHELEEERNRSRKQSE